MKINWKEDLRDILGGIIIFLLLIILFGDFITSNLLFYIIVLLFFFINYGIILFHERKYKENFPYEPYKSKNNIGKRILIGLWAGAHYLFFIGSYNHKEYNTQVFYPETLECVFGNISQAIIFFAYIFIAINLFELFGYYSLFFMVIPIITNLISLRKH